jgi:hypothetical protein
MQNHFAQIFLLQNACHKIIRQKNIFARLWDVLNFGQAQKIVARFMPAKYSAGVTVYGARDFRESLKTYDKK